MIVKAVRPAVATFGMPAASVCDHGVETASSTATWLASTGNGAA